MKNGAIELAVRRQYDLSLSAKVDVEFLASESTDDFMGTLWEFRVRFEDCDGQFRDRRIKISNVAYEPEHWEN